MHNVCEILFWKASFNCFQCKKLDSWENVRGVVTLNKTLANQTYEDYLRVSGQIEQVTQLHFSLLEEHVLFHDIPAKNRSEQTRGRGARAKMYFLENHWHSIDTIWGSETKDKLKNKVQTSQAALRKTAYSLLLKHTSVGCNHSVLFSLGFTV